MTLNKQTHYRYLILTMITVVRRWKCCYYIFIRTLTGFWKIINIKFWWIEKENSTDFFDNCFWNILSKYIIHKGNLSINKKQNYRLLFSDLKILLIYLIIIDLFLKIIFIYFPKKKVSYVCVRKKNLERDKSEEKKLTDPVIQQTIE